MEENKELMAILERMEKSHQQQEKYARAQCLFSALTAVCCIAVLIAVLTLLPQLKEAAQQADAVLANAEQVSRQLAQADIDGVMADLEEVTRQMAQADLTGLVREVGDLVRSSQSGVEEALDTLSSIDLETLNQAIGDLAAVVEPMANLVGRFR